MTHVLFIVHAPPLRDKDCKKILDAFKSAFVSKDPCSITREDYQPLINLTADPVPCDKVTKTSQ